MQNFYQGAFFEIRENIIIAFSIKLLLQSGSVHPALSQLSYGFRPIIIGYLHLVPLAVTNIFMIGYIFSFQMIGLNRKLIAGVFIFVAGIIINEILLMVQGKLRLIIFHFQIWMCCYWVLR